MTMSVLLVLVVCLIWVFTIIDLFVRYRAFKKRYPKTVVRPQRVSTEFIDALENAGARQELIKALRKEHEKR